MMNKNIINIVLSGLLLVLTSFLSSCNDTNDWSTDDSYARLFRTSKLVVSPGINEANVIWNNTVNTDYYIIEVSKKELTSDDYQEGSIIYGNDKNIKGSPFVVSDLDANTTYYVRIRSCSETLTPSKWVYPETPTFKTKTEQLLEDISSITGSSAIVTWKKNQKVTHFQLKNLTTNEPVNIPITTEMNTAGTYTLTGLEASTSYTIGIYNTVDGAEVLRGEKSFKTTEKFPDGYTPVYLTESDDINTVLAAQSGKIVLVVPHSTNIEFTTSVIIPESITSIVIWGASGGAEKATIKTKPILTLGTKDEVRFYNLTIDPQDDYLFNLQKTDALTEDITTDINSIIFDNCIIEPSNAIVRSKGGIDINIGKAVISNSIIKKSKGALFAFKESEATTIDNIELINSTVMNIAQQYVYTYKTHNVAIKIKDCTLYNIGSSKAFVEINSGDATNTSTINIENSIMATSTGKFKACNLKNKCNCSNVYATSDCTYDAGYVSGITDSEYSSAVLFVDPAGGDFHIKEPLFTANVGDPRWKE